MVVVVILAIMSALIAPSFKSFFFRAQRDKAKSDLTNIIRTAIYRATQSRDVRTFHLDIENGWYWVQPRERKYGRETKREVEKRLPDRFRFVSVYRTEEQEAYTRDEAIIEVWPNGTTENFEIVIAEMDEEGRDKNYFLLTVVGTTARISWDPLDRSEIRCGSNPW
jgi:type II secretory pathway pseudopilin PulG